MCFERLLSGREPGHVRTPRLLVTAATLSALTLVACGGSDDTSADTDSEAPETSQTEVETEDDTTEDGSDAVVSEDGISSGVATITFADGSTLTAEVVCTLEPQEAAGQEIV
jgi:hypothetical protein